MKRALAMATLALLALGSIFGASSSPAEHVTVQLNWLHYGLFGGLYAADRNGTFAHQGLTVSFLEGGPI